MAVTLNDIHSGLNSTTVSRVLRPTCVADVVVAAREAVSRGECVSIAGGRHAMGGQQFGAGTLHLDMTGLNQVTAFDEARGLLSIGAGAAWPAIIEATRERQGGAGRWGIRQKQTGADALTLGGAISANVHGRGLTLPPIISDIENLTLVTANGDVVHCSRDERADLFALVCGGYGLFGVVVEATLRLGPRMRLRRHVDIVDIDDAMNAVWRRIDQGFLYGDFQYAIDPRDDSFLRRGVFACYEPVGPCEDEGAEADLSEKDWLDLLHLAHTDKREAFRKYSAHYLETHGRTYWSDSMQLATYIPSYADFLASALPHEGRRSLMITELYVPPERLMEFIAAAREVLRRTGVDDIYGTIRAVRQDQESFLAWARGDWACIIFNLLVRHTPEGEARAQEAARALIDAAADQGGSFYLTYHRWATREQLLRCHPRLPEFLEAKRAHDPRLVFQSEWWRHVDQLIRGGE